MRRTTRNQTVRVALLTNTVAAADGGPAEYAVNLVDALVRAGVSAEISQVRRTRKNALRPEMTDVVCGKLATLRLVKRAQAVSINGYYLWWVPIACVIARALGSEAWITPHGSLTRHQRKFSVRKKYWFDRVARPIVRRTARGFLLNSAQECDELRDVFPDAEMHVVGIGVHLPPILNRSASSSSLELLSLSRIAPKKRIDVAIRAVDLLRQRGLNTRLTVAGSGSPELESQLRALSENLGVVDHVAFVGWLGAEEKEQVFAKTSLFVLPSEDENFGIAPVEALSWGIPCIVTPAVASMATVSSRAATVVDAPSAELVAQAVVDAITDGYQDRCHQARRDAEEHFSWGAVVDRWETVLPRGGSRS